MGIEILQGLHGGGALGHVNDLALACANDDTSDCGGRVNIIN
jgi:hypothetical protein